MTDSERTQINQYIEQIAQGSYTAIDSLAQMVSGRMLSVALSVVRNRALAEDVVQDSFLRILSKAATFRKGTNGYAWICKIVHNTALNALRRERRFRALNYDDLPFLSDGPQPPLVQQLMEYTVTTPQALAVTAAEAAVFMALIAWVYRRQGC